MKKPIDIKFTKEGYEKLKRDYQELLERRPGVVSRMSAAREQGDLSENAGYHAAKEELGSIDRRLREFKILMRFGEVVEATKGDTVSLGTKVTVSTTTGNQEFEIVGKMEADPVRGKLSEISPIGSALLGKKVGDEINVQIPDGVVKFKVVKVN